MSVHGRQAVAIVAAVALLGGCAAGTSSAPGSAPPTTASPAAAASPAARATPAASPGTAAIREILDVRYATALTAQGRDVALDIYVPAGQGRWPAVVWAHGGEQSKINGIGFARKMAAKGAIVLVPDLVHGASPNDEPLGIASRSLYEQADCVVRMARSAAATYGGDADRVLWSGYSFGGVVGFAHALTDPGAEQAWDAYVAKSGGPTRQYACVATEPSIPLEGLVTAGSARGVDIWPDTYATDPALRAFVDSIERIGNNPGIKVRMINGVADSEVPADVGRGLAERLKAAGYDVTFTPVEGAGHLPFDDRVVGALTEILGACGAHCAAPPPSASLAARTGPIRPSA